MCPVHFPFLSSFSTHSYDEETGSMDSGYPRSIESDFPGIGDEIDAVTYQYGTDPYIQSFHVVIPLCFSPVSLLSSRWVFVRLLVFLP